MFLSLSPNIEFNNIYRKSIIFVNIIEMTSRWVQKPVSLIPKSFEDMKQISKNKIKLEQRKKNCINSYLLFFKKLTNMLLRIDLYMPTA